jgi:hypothetical protein
MRYEGKEFRNQTLILDGNSYVRCTIVDCILSYSGTTEISLSECNMGSNEFAYDGYAANTVRTLQSIAHAGAGGLDHVMRIFLGNVPVDWHKVAAMSELPTKPEDQEPAAEEEQPAAAVRRKG